MYMSKCTDVTTLMDFYHSFITLPSTVLPCFSISSHLIFYPIILCGLCDLLSLVVSVRFVGLSTALANAKDLGEWLGIPHSVGLFNFRPSVRPIPMSIYIQGFPGKHYCPRMATMNKPAYACILEHSPTKPVLVFVSSRRQTRLTALDLISYCASDDHPEQFLHLPEDEAAAIASTLRDSALRDTLVFGIGIHHAGLDKHDRDTVEALFVAGKIQVLVCTSTLAWGVNFPAHLVIVKGIDRRRKRKCLQ